MQEILQNIPRRKAIERMSAAAGVIAIAGGGAVTWAFDPAKAHFLPPCPLLSLTGFACPGCGLTRGFHALSHGDLITALDLNALVPIWGAVFVYLLVSLAMTAVRGRGLPMRMPSITVLMSFLVILLTFGVLRNLPFYPFSSLFP